MKGMIIMILGAQLYTVRDFTQTENDFEETIRKVAAIGYKTVQVSGIGPVPVKNVADILKAHDITCVITHTGPARIKDETDAVIEEHNILGTDYIGIGMMPEEYRGSLEGVKRFVGDFAPAAERIRAAGKKFMYHNHDLEFEKFDGRLVMEYIADCSNIGFTLDTYWVQAGGADPAEWLEKLSGRVDVIHVKDMTWRNGSPYMCEVMEGNLNWQSIIKAAGAAGVKHAMVEQDDCYGADPFDCLRTSYENWAKRII